MVAQRRRTTAPSKPRASRLRRLLRQTAIAALLILVLLPLLVLAAYRVVAPPVTPLMVIRAIQGEGMDYRYRPASALSPHLARAMIASEDNLFCEHWGFDAQALRTQFERARAGERPRGASTITQQLAKNLFLWPGRDMSRKVLEAWLAPQLELVLGKARILELYVNVVELGPGIYGAEAASRHWFGKSAAELSEREAARLAVILPAPLTRTPASDFATRRSGVIQQRIGQLGPLLDCAP